MLNKSILVFSIFCLFIISLKAQEKVIIDQVVAVVGKQVILQSDIESQAMQLRSQGYYTSGDLKCEIFEEMLYSKLLVNQAILDSVQVSDSEIASEMERRLNYFINQIGSEEKLEEFYDKSIPEIKEEFKEVIKDQLLSQRMQQEAASDISVTPQEVKAYYKSMPEDSLPMINTEFEIEQIIVNPKTEEVEILRLKDELREFKKRIENGESFAVLAGLYSEDPGSRVKGGELGFVSRGDLVSEFSAVAFNLKVGEISKIVKTDYGYHIIQLVEKKGERINCKHILLKPKVSSHEMLKAKHRLDSVRTLLINKELTFKEACWKFSEDEETRLNGGVMVNPQTGNSRWEASHLEPKVAYAIKNLEVGQISSPFESEDMNGTKVYKIVTIKSKSEPHSANLKDDYQRIQDLALGKKRAEFMEEWVAKKVKNTYVKIDDDFNNCTFKNNIWKNL
ncbi:MAG: peptidylprolyl isomerase [Salinivirgaceae bacterium]|nr:peptidylprolyl isomerase [Salinivirgaceae bacterium]